MKELAVTVELLEPYRVQLWYEKEERHSEKYARGLGYVRLHKSKKTKRFVPYIPGTLLRSRLLFALERLLVLTGGKWKGEICCNAAFLPDKGKASFLRK